MGVERVARLYASTEVSRASAAHLVLRWLQPYILVAAVY
jgi:hypothetical protein